MKIEKENIIKIHPKFYSKRYIILDFLEFVLYTEHEESIFYRI